MLTTLLLAFCGGAFGAAVGALPAFIICGLLVILGSTIMLAGGGDQFLTNIAFGHIFGPHVAFAGGVAAAAYAAKHKLIKGSGKDIITPLLFQNKTGTLIVGGIFGVIGFLLFSIIRISTEPPFVLDKLDAIAGSIFISAIIARLCFSRKPVVANHPVIFNENPENKKTGIWLPWESNWLSITLLGTFLGIIYAHLALETGSEVLGFGIAAFSLLFLQFGNHVPVSHHIALPASVAALVTGNLFFGVVFAIIGALLGELAARLFYNSGDTHIDPPAFSIFVTSFFICFLS